MSNLACPANLPRHGVVIDPAGEPACSVGMLELAFQLETFPPALKTDPAARKINMPTFVRFHFVRVCSRLFSSLGRLDEHVRAWDKFLRDGALAGPNPSLAHTVPDEAGIAADSVVHYLSAFVDDVARTIPLALGTEPLPDGEGLSWLKRRISARNWTPPAPIGALFSELNDPASWWWQGFSRGGGMRHRLVHYTDLVHFGGTTRPGDDHMSSNVSLGAVGGPVSHTDFEAALRTLFAGLFGWLDRLERELRSSLVARHGQWPLPSKVVPDCAFSLPRGRITSWGAPGPSYLYLPLCR